ncbi:MAG: response regulator [Bacteroidales bacterium]|nr:response regulator [Bacteroidales bacterium]
MIRFYNLFMGTLLFINSALFAQQNIFINYSLEDGVPQSTVLAIYQDLNRNLWIGTQGGVCKYNGHDFVTIDTRHGLTDNHITQILQDHEGRHWFGHRYNGLTLMKGRNFIKLPVVHSRINAIREDPFGNIWFGSLDSSIFILPQGKEAALENFIHLMDEEHPEMETIYDLLIVDYSTTWIATSKGLREIKFNIVDHVWYSVELPEHEFLQNTRFYSMIRDHSGNFWLLYDEGLCRLERDESGTLQNTKYPFGMEIEVDYIRNLTIDKNHNIWGACQQGIFRFRDGSFKLFTEQNGLSDPITNAVTADVEGNLWIGTTNMGVFKYPGDKFKVFNSASGLTSEVVISTIEDSKGNLWIGTNEGVFVNNGNRIEKFKMPISQDDYEVNAIYEDSRGNIWFGSYSHFDIVRYNSTTGTFRTFDVSDGLATRSVISISEDKNGCVWFATLGIGVSKYTYPVDDQPEKFEKYSIGDGLCSVYIWIIHRDRDGNLWFGSDDAGITMYDGKNFTSYNEHDGLQSLSAGAIAHDSRNNIWIATIGGGIYKFDGRDFINYGVDDGLSSDNPFSIICDENDHVWVGSNIGIDKFIPETELFKHYGKEEGFVGIETNQNAVFKGRGGIIWFGTVKGLIRFDPAQDQPNLLPPSTVIENVKLFFSEFDYGEYSDSLDNFNRLPVGLSLPYRKNHLTFEYSGVSLEVPGKVRYQYKLENFDAEWNPVTKSMVATYTNIPAGKYTFKVIACNNDGYWNHEPTRLSFTIMAPYWQTWWFILILVGATIGLIYLVFYLRLRTINNQKLKLQRLVEVKTRELIIEMEEKKKAMVKAEQADRLKSAFLANMSHEIRTPVNAITGFTELLYDEHLEEEDRKKYLDYINKGGKTLLSLIDDIIDISKIEAGQLVIRKESCSLRQMMGELFMMFHELKQKKGKHEIDLRVSKEIREKDLNIKTDATRLRQILSNLINNAVKFTETGHIEFGYRLKEPGRITFYVEDTGIGIPADKLDIVFQRFRQVEETFTKNYEGTGLGLAISKKLTHLLGGEMWVESVLGEGTTFYFSIPLHITGSEAETVIPSVSAPDLVSLENKNILIVEDEDSNYFLTETILKSCKANVFRASNGLTAVDTIRNNGRHFDLVLMDIKIPGINGLEATREIKKINREIPVIAQTAYAMAGEKDKCLAAGCDDYISKPIDRKLLLGKIRMQLNGVKKG